jgi:hypothetical protein
MYGSRWNRQGGSLGPALDHMQHDESGHRPFAERVALARAEEECPFLVAAYSSRADQSIGVFLEWFHCNQRRVVKPPK